MGMGMGEKKPQQIDALLLLLSLLLLLDAWQPRSLVRLRLPIEALKSMSMSRAPVTFPLHTTLPLQDSVGHVDL
jgi:hypothetical protein